MKLNSAKIGQAAVAKSLKPSSNVSNDCAVDRGICNRAPLRFVKVDHGVAVVGKRTHLFRDRPGDVVRR